VASLREFDICCTGTDEVSGWLVENQPESSRQPGWREVECTPSGFKRAVSSRSTSMFDPYAK
jgi:hypothetical protein